MPCHAMPCHALRAVTSCHVMRCTMSCYMLVVLSKSWVSAYLLPQLVVCTMYCLLSPKSVYLFRLTSIVACVVCLAVLTPSTSHSILLLILFFFRPLPSYIPSYLPFSFVNLISLLSLPLPPLLYFPHIFIPRNLQSTCSRRFLPSCCRNLSGYRSCLFGRNKESHGPDHPC
jgi:hypothetical protein